MLAIFQVLNISMWAAELGSSRNIGYVHRKTQFHRIHVRQDIMATVTEEAQ